MGDESSAPHYLEQELQSRLREGGTLLAFLRAGLVDGLWYWDVERGDQEWYSEEFKRLLGYAGEEVPNLSSWWQERVFPEDLELVRRNLKRHFADPRCPYDQVVRYLHRDGSTVWVRARGVAIRDGDGRPIRLLGAHTDLTSLKRAQSELFEAELRAERERAAAQAHATAFEAAPTGMVQVDDEGRIVLFNRRAEETFGYGREEVLGEPVEVLIPERFAGPHVGFREVYLRHPEARAMGAGRDLFGRRKNGDEFPVEIGLNPVRIGSRVGVVTAVVDITERKRAAELFQRAVDSSPSAMVAIDGTRRVVLVNTRAEVLFGYARDELVGRPVDLLVPPCFEPQDRDGLRVPFLDSDASERVARMDLRGLRKDGTEFPVEVGLNPLETPDGTLVLCAIVDITERKRTEERLHAVVAELGRSNADLEQFAYAASHDMQEPLRAVTGFLQLLERHLGDDLDDKARGYVSHALEGAQRMRTLIDGLLAYARVRMRHEEMRPVDLARPVDDAAANLRLALEEVDAEILVGSLPTVRADAAQMTLLFQNLISNAIKFRGDEPPRVRIVERTPIGHFRRIAVVDNGLGIDPQYANRIFGLFQRLHTQERYPGTGIGLAVCRQIVHRHGGKISVESSPGKGATFLVQLPNEPPMWT